MRAEKGFTLLELVVGMALVGLLMTLAGSWLHRWRAIETAVDAQRTALAPVSAEIDRRIRLRQTVPDTLEDGRVIHWTRDLEARSLEAPAVESEAQGAAAAEIDRTASGGSGSNRNQQSIGGSGRPVENE